MGSLTDEGGAKLSSLDDGWIEWNGGKCPLPDDLDHEVRFRDGFVEWDNEPQTWEWKHEGHGCDIVAYRRLDEPA